MNHKKRKKPDIAEKKDANKQLSLLSFFSASIVAKTHELTKEISRPAFRELKQVACEVDTEDDNDGITHKPQAASLHEVDKCNKPVSNNVNTLGNSHMQLHNEGYEELMKKLGDVSGKQNIDDINGQKNSFKLSPSPKKPKSGKENNVHVSEPIPNCEEKFETPRKHIKTCQIEDLHPLCDFKHSPSKLTKKKNLSVDVEDIENLDDFFDDDWSGLPNYDILSLKDWKYCVIVKTEETHRGLLLDLQEHKKGKKSGLSTSCLVKGYWCDMPLKCEDVISIKAYYDTALNVWRVDDEKGYIVKDPDTLLSGTCLVGSLFCQRQAVLSHLFPGLGSKNPAMLTGSLIHELMQEVLRRKMFEEEQIKSLATNLLNQPRTLFSAYECGISLSDLKTELDQIIPEIINFNNLYILEKISDGKTWPGRIKQVLSTEENFWIPSLGVKGKTDFIVRTEVDARTRLMPLELKTGRATNSVEHRGQIVLYLMMMSEVGLDAEAGLLLYLKHNSMKEIKPNVAEYRGLITTRNNLVDYYSMNEIFDPSNGNIFVPKLPEPINHRSGCSKCPYLTVCSAFLNEEKEVKLSDTNPLKTLRTTCLEHLSGQHIQYVLLWLSLLKLEEMERRKECVIRVSDIWRMSAEERQTRGYCLNNLSVTGIQKYGSKFLHYMKCCEGQSRDFTKSGLAENDYVVVSTRSRFAVVTGYVHSISATSLCLRVDRELETLSKVVYIVDKNSVSEALLAFNTSSLFLLLEDTKSAARLRRLVIDKEVPMFSTAPHIRSVDSDSILGELNQFQREAILKTMAAEDYLLIKGLPGTGKTATIAALVRLLVRLKYSVLVTSHTHSAVDNILLRLKGSVQFLRLGSSGRVHADLQSYCEEYVVEQCNINTTEQLEQLYNQQPVIAVTCMGCSHHLLSKRVFDFCIVDEATQVLQPSVLKSLYSSRKFVLVGDPNQLPPVVQSRDASRLGFDESLFKKLDRPEVTTSLYLQYRMNSEIMKLANSFAYDDLLQCDNRRVQTATIQVEQPAQLIEEHTWLRAALSANIQDSIVFLNTCNLPVPETYSQYSNQMEADITFLIVKSLIQDVRSIGVIAPYREQVNLLRKMASANNYDIEINTVDQYQGRDKDVIIYSCTKHSNKKEGGILADKRRLTVAITRAKRKLIIVGNVFVLKKYSVFEDLISLIPEDNFIDIESL